MVKLEEVRERTFWNFMKHLRFQTVALVFGAFISISAAQSGRDVAVYPWIFKDGNVTSRSMAIATAKRIAENQGLHVIAHDTSVGKFDSLRPKISLEGDLPSEADLARFAKAVHAGNLIFGVVSWHTRSIWVGTGPKTVSTATVDAYVYNTKAGKVTYSQEHVEARSDEKESTLKAIAAILITPIIPMVSGGPATPREQRAVQIAMSKALLGWTQQISR